MSGRSMPLVLVGTFIVRKLETYATAVQNMCLDPGPRWWRLGECVLGGNEGSLG